MLRKIFFVFIILVIIFGFLAVLSLNKTKETKISLPKFAVSLYPLALVLQEIAQEKAEIIWLGEGQGVHEVTFRPEMIQRLSQAKGMFVSGYNLDFWAENFAQKVNLPIFRVNEEAPKILTKEGYLNPHIWNSFAGLSAIAKKMTAVLQKLDSKNSDFYQENLNQFLANLEKLKETYQKKFAKLQKVPFLAYHDALVPLFFEFNLNYQGNLVIGERSLTPKEILALQSKIRNLKIKVIFNDAYKISPRLANFAENNNLKIVSLDPMESGQVELGVILQILQNNLESIKKSLENEST